ncbi:hypothetical protein TPHA_0P00420 [Tetrapisispora phaffii CBS 4417]|uniref:ATPase expression protein 3 n=1 Tax=Tetrapisispora phaffii (strain ATCC 24235 / CBS 4417 / NBRC 1672 / NRRL Y-8282 / UCD 70-5) TaxID=1071381 RepID=G8C222_TETPH|nr:hypothetical protein TPHA_0P00420 [Tetrapisispora phaffii CBS 4417]CCE66200.1 hypothetical protein TPHA_0P00420 [Tetrapisispora phaffii CBS 4417]
MNVLSRLSVEVAKNGVKGKVPVVRYVLPKEFELVNKKEFIDKSNNTNDEKSKSSKNSYGYVREHMTLVGRGSNYQKKQVQEYLSPLRPYKLRRQEINKDYDQEKSIEYTKFTLHKKKEERLGFGLSEDFLGELLAALIKNLPKRYEGQDEVDKADNLNDDDIPSCKYAYPKFSKEEIPKIPDFEKHPEKFPEYVGLLTHCDFYYRNSSKSNGIIPKILRNLFHPSNVKTLHLRSVDSFNDLIYYFSNKFDFASCREFLAQMKVENIKPNTKTYNLLIMNVLKNSHIRKGKSIRPELKFLFHDMQKNQVTVDEITWNICFNFLNNGLSKDIYIEQMVKHGVAITPEFVYTVFRNDKTYSSSDILNYLTENKISMTYKIFKLCIEKLLKQQKSKVVWEMIQFAMDNNSHEPGQMKVTYEVVDKLLAEFARRGRIDLTLMTLNKFLLDYKLTPSVNTFDMCFKSLSNSGYSKNFEAVYRYIVKLKSDSGLPPYKSYWAVKCQSTIKFNCRQLHDKEAEIIRGMELLNSLRFPKDKYVDFTWYIRDSNIRKTLRYLGCTLHKIHDKQINPVNKDKSNYRQRIRFIAIQKSMVNKIDYSMDYYKTLKRELRDRSII